MSHPPISFALSLDKIHEFFQETNRLPVQLLQENGKIVILNSANSVLGEITPALAFTQANENHSGRPSDLNFSINYLVMLVQAGIASLGAFEQGNMLYHKVIRKYMVRKCQGKNQLKHLREKGKSREGSRIRLQQTQEFIHEIQDTLTGWKEILDETGMIYYSCDVRLFSEIFSGDKKSVISPSGIQFIKIPFYVKPPNYKELVHVNYSLSTSTLILYPANNELSWELEKIVHEILA